MASRALYHHMRNATAHAIAVYASRPPAATQHSLPSGRYPLLGPDLHRLDRTSLRLDAYSITSSARSWIAVDRSTPIALAVLRLITSSNFTGC